MFTVSINEVAAQLAFVDDPDVIERAGRHLPLALALEMSRPENWHGTGLRPEQIIALAVRDGIPVAWVPPADVLVALVAAEPSCRQRVLLDRRSQISAHLSHVLDACDDPWLGDDPELLRRALATFDAGYHEGAMALAVSVADSLAAWAVRDRVQVFANQDECDAWAASEAALPPKDRTTAARARRRLKEVWPWGPDTRRRDVLRAALLGPIPVFFASWYPGNPDPRGPSRHKTVHRPSLAHLSEAHALMALMFATSLLRESQAWADEVRTQDSLWCDLT